jgi:hypothetical protein
MHRLACQRTNINTIIYDMRQSGATLQQIADKIGKTKERVRQILVQNYGSTRHQLISTEQLCRLSGLPRNRIIELYEDSVVIPEVEWNTGIRHYLLWSPATWGQVISYYKRHRLCKICHRPIPNDRRVYCCAECCKEGHKYRYKSAEARERRRIRNGKRTKRIRQSEGHLKVVSYD